MVARQRELGTETIRGLLFDAAEMDAEARARISGLWVGILERAARRGEIGIRAGARDGRRECQ